MNEKGGGSFIGGVQIPVLGPGEGAKQKMNLSKSIEFNRPFAYFIVDTQRALILLQGVLKVPQEAMNFM